MKPLTRSSRWTAGLLTATLALATLVPAAQADRGGSRVRYKGGPSVRNVRVVRHAYAPRRVIIQRSDSVAPALIGFIGGLVIGSTLHSHPAYVAPAVEYCYWDPYCHESFASLDSYARHAGRARHPELVRVIEVGTGECVRSLEYVDGVWYERAPEYPAHFYYADPRGEDWED